jgi:hypothetical protein
MTEPAKRSFFDSLKDALIESSPDSVQPSKMHPPPLISNGPPVFPAISSTGYKYPPATEPSGPDPAIQATLEAKLKGGVTKEYQAFSEQYEQLKEYISDDEKLFRAALGASKVSAPQIQSSLDSMAKILEGARDEFENTFKVQAEKTQTVYDSKLTGLETAAMNAKAEIARLQASLSQIEVDKQTETEQYQKQLRKHVSLKDRFSATYSHVAANLARQRSRIKV